MHVIALRRLQRVWWRCCGLRVPPDVTAAKLSRVPRRRSVPPEPVLAPSGKLAWRSDHVHFLLVAYARMRWRVVNGGCPLWMPPGDAPVAACVRRPSSPVFVCPCSMQVPYVSDTSQHGASGRPLPTRQYPSEFREDGGRHVRLQHQSCDVFSQADGRCCGGNTWPMCGTSPNPPSAVVCCRACLCMLVPVFVFRVHVCVTPVSCDCWLVLVVPSRTMRSSQETKLPCETTFRVSWKRGCTSPTVQRSWRALCEAGFVCRSCRTRVPLRQPLRQRLRRQLPRRHRKQRPHPSRPLVVDSVRVVCAAVCVGDNYFRDTESLSTRWWSVAVPYTIFLLVAQPYPPNSLKA